LEYFSYLVARIAVRQNKYSIHATNAREVHVMSTSEATAKAPRRPLLSLDTWAVIAASALVLATLAGTLPRIPW